MDTARTFPHGHVATASDDLRTEQIAALAQLFPEIVTEGKIDFDRLRALLGDAVDTRPERYAFNWNGKRDAIRLAQTPSSATLVPEPDPSVNWDTTHNLFVEGDNLEVLKLLHRAYFGRVKMIYIDPPYNTGNDFVYPDDYSDPLHTYLEITGQRDADGNLLSSNADRSGRYHSRWLSMMYPRLLLARSFLRDDGVIFVSIDDNEVADLRLMMNEVFGEENFLGTFVWKRRSGAMDAVNGMSTDHEYVLCYGKTLRGEERTFERYSNPDDDPRGPWVADNLSAAKPGGDTWYAVKDPATGYEYWPPKGRYWPYNPATMRQKIAEGRVLFPGTPNGSPLLKRFQHEAKSLFRPVSSWIVSPQEETDDVRQLSASINTEGTREIKELFGDKAFLYPKPGSLLQALIRQGTTSEQDIVLDFFSGSCTCAQAVLELNRQDGGNRRFIMVQLPEPTGNPQYPTITDIGKERIRRAIAKFRRADEGTLGLTTRETPEDLGFRVFRLAQSHIAQWQPPAGTDPGDYVRQMQLALDPIQAGAETIALIWETAIREGYGLGSQIAHVSAVTGARVYQVTDPDRDQRFSICLDDTISLDALRPLDLTRDDLFICRDVALDDTTGANLALQCRLKTL